MNTREDFEIYKVTNNGRERYRFKVDYIGVYSAPTEKAILELRRKVRRQVKAKLEWVERENQKYYARMAEREHQRALFLKALKDIEREADKK